MNIELHGGWSVKCSECLILSSLTSPIVLSISVKERCDAVLVPKRWLSARRTYTGGSSAAQTDEFTFRLNSELESYSLELGRC